MFFVHMDTVAPANHDGLITLRVGQRVAFKLEKRPFARDIAVVGDGFSRIVRGRRDIVERPTAEL